MIHLRKNLSDPWCGAINSGEFLTLTDEPTTVSCPECLRLEEVYRKEPISVKCLEPSWFKDWARFGEGTYGELDWIALGIMTCGLGIPVMWLLKKLVNRVKR